MAVNRPVGDNARKGPGQDWRLEVTDEFANPLYVIDVRADRVK